MDFSMILHNRLQPHIESFDSTAAGTDLDKPTVLRSCQTRDRLFTNSTKTQHLVFHLERILGQPPTAIANKHKFVVWRATHSGNTATFQLFVFVGQVYLVKICKSIVDKGEMSYGSVF